MPRHSRSRRTLNTLLKEAGLVEDVSWIAPLSIGWAGRRGSGEGTYRDDDGTHARVVLGNGQSVIYREYASTGWSSETALSKEAFLFRQLAKAGVPTPGLLAQAHGDQGPGGNPWALLLSDRGGSPLQEVATQVPKLQRVSLWSEAGAMLRRLHSADVSLAGPLAEPAAVRPWMNFVPYFAKSLRNLRRKHGDLAPNVDELLRLLRSQVAPHLARKARAICCGGYSLPGMLFERDKQGWGCRAWLSLGYYVSVGDPDRDVAAIAVLCREATGYEIPGSFYRAYGRRPDPISELVYGAYHSHPATWPEILPSTVEKLRSLLQRAP